MTTRGGCGWNSGAEELLESGVFAYQWIRGSSLTNRRSVLWAMTRLGKSGLMYFSSVKEPLRRAVVSILRRLS